MRHLKGLVIGISVLALLGCAAQQNAASSKAMPEADEMASMEGLPTLVDQIGGDFYVYDHDGRYYVIGSAEMAKKFKGSGHLPYTHTLMGAGPHGRTVIFEVVKKKPELWSACKRCMRAPPTWWQGRVRIILGIIHNRNQQQTNRRVFKMRIYWWQGGVFLHPETTKELSELRTLVNS